MRRKLKSFFVLTLAFSVLTGSVGMAATKRFCAMLGGEVTAMEMQAMEKKGCCSSKPKPASKAPANTKSYFTKTDCCSVSTDFQKLDLEAGLSLQKITLEAAPAPLPFSFSFSTVRVAWVKSTWPFYSDTSPPLSGRDRLHRLQVLTI